MPAGEAAHGSITSFGRTRREDLSDRRRVVAPSGRPLEAINAFQQGRRQAVRDSKRARCGFLLSEVGITWNWLGEWARGCRDPGNGRRQKLSA